MPLSTASVGTTAEPLRVSIDARWTMAYAAGLGDHHDCYMDTTRPGGVVAHPLFPVAVEWQLQSGGRGARREGLTRAEAGRGVHYSNDLVLHRPVRAGDEVTVTATDVGGQRHRSGAMSMTRFVAVDSDGLPVWTTWTQGLLRGVEVDGDDRVIESPPPLPVPVDDSTWAAPPVTSVPVNVSAGAAHVYTECARIWNPIHTDAAVAEAAGLPSIILHGTATLALGVSKVVDAVAGGDPTQVSRIFGRFGAMVPMPTALTVEVFEPIAGEGVSVVPFEVRNADGGPAVRKGVVALRA